MSANGEYLTFSVDEARESDVWVLDVPEETEASPGRGPGANLQHPHILPLFDSGEADGFLYYVMPLPIHWISAAAASRSYRNVSWDTVDFQPADAFTNGNPQRTGPRSITRACRLRSSHQGPLSATLRRCFRSSAR